MQKVMLFTSIGLLFFCLSVSGQKINTDSLTLASRINADLLRLDKLQDQLKQLTENKQDASVEAQRSANKNVDAADKLKDNPDNKKLARKANKRASDAKRESRDARKASNRLDKLQRDIQEVKERIAKNEIKLNKYKQAGRINSPTVDTIQH